MNKLIIRTICPGDDAALAHIIRQTLTEFGAARPRTVFGDPTTDRLFAHYQRPRSSYFVALSNETVVGGAGIRALEGAPKGICELQKMYLLPEARGQGTGKKLIETCLEFARVQGYTQCYLESMPELQKAVKIYEKFGFEYLDAPRGKTGHEDCTLWMLKFL